MFEGLTASARAIVSGGQKVALATGAPLIESEHLLVALAGLEGSAAQAALSRAGLTAPRLLELMETERTRSLRHAGIDPIPVSSPPRAAGDLRLATSAKNALGRATAEAARSRTRRIDPAALLRAVLEQEAGTVPRLLALGGVEPAALLAGLAEES